jgi:hypothetical protein
LPGAAVLTLLLSSVVADLAPEAASSSRPRACPALTTPANRAPDPSASAHAVWQRARQHGFERYCDELAGAQVSLGTAPDESLKIAQALGLQWPERSEPKLLAARALTRLGRYAEAWPLFVGSAAANELPSAGTLVLHDYAMSASMTGHAALALTAYRALVTRAAALQDPAYEQRLLVEASAAALRLELPAAEEASGYLAAAAEAHASLLLATCVAGLARLSGVLGPGSVSDAPPIDAAAAWQFLRQVESPVARPTWPVLPRHELLGIAALVIEPHAPERAVELWREYLAGLDGQGLDGQPRAASSRAHDELARMLARAKAAP